MDWLQWITASGAVGALGLAVATWLKQRPAMKLAETQGEQSLWAEIAQLKREAKAEREECGHRISTLEAKVADLEHDLASETMNFDAFLMIAEANPERLAEMLPAISEKRREHKERMALKRGAREGAKIAAPKTKGDGN
jgi:hypothetical protein